MWVWGDSSTFISGLHKKKYLVKSRNKALDLGEMKAGNWDWYYVHRREGEAMRVGGNSYGQSQRRAGLVSRKSKKSPRGACGQGSEVSVWQVPWESNREQEERRPPHRRSSMLGWFVSRQFQGSGRGRNLLQFEFKLIWQKARFWRPLGNGIIKGVWASS